MLDSIYHMKSKLIKKKCIFGVKTSRFCHLLSKFIMGIIYKATSSLSILLHGFISLLDATLCNKGLDGV